MEIIDELYDALQAGDGERFTQIHLAQPGHDLFFEVQVDYEEQKQRQAFLVAARKVLPENFMSDLKLASNPLNLSNVGMLYPKQTADLFMAVLICAIDENDNVMLERLHNIEPKDSETLGGHLDGYGHHLMTNGEFSKSVKVYDLALKFASPGKSVYANALWVAQKDNTGLPIDPERNRRWLDICLPHGSENHGIFFNAACVYMELGEPDQVIENINKAIFYGNAEGPEAYLHTRKMTEDAMFEPIRDKIDAIFTQPPKGVNPKAWWSDEDGEWVYGEKDAQGLFQGKVQYWRPGGTLCCETDHIDGQPNGQFTRYHENGNISRQGRLLHTQMIGEDTAYRSYDFTSEKAIPEQVPKSIHTIVTHWVDGNFSHQVLSDIDGNLMTPVGDRVPDRPEKVPEGAFFLNDIWHSGTYSKDADKVGEWFYYLADGEFQKEEFYDENSNCAYTIIRSDRTDAAFEKGNLVSGEWVGLVSLLDENKKEIGTYDSTGADLVKDPKLRQWVRDVREVNWKAYESAYHDTELVAQHLITYGVSEDEETRDSAMGALYSYIYHQGTIYESSAIAIPFLIQLSAISKFEDVQIQSLLLVEYMALVPRGKYDYWTSEGETFGCVSAVSKCAYDLMTLYSLSDHEVQKITVLNCLAASFENPDVPTFMKEETTDLGDYSVRIASLGNLKAIPAEMYSAIDSMPPILQLAVIYGAALWHDGPKIPNSLELVLALLDKDLDSQFQHFPCSDGSVIDELSFLIQPDEASIGGITEKLVKRIGEQHAINAIPAIASALQLVFAKEEFLPQQGEILRALLAKDDLWVDENGEPNTFINFTEILDQYEFPHGRSEIQNIVDEYYSAKN